jgi:drug/metabolite transporter (DMT)-like permease
VPIHAKLLCACVFWGATPTIGRVLAEFEAPFVVVCGRFLVATVFLLWFMFSARAFVRIPRRLWWRFAVIGVTGILLHNGLLYKGLEYTTAITASVILALIAVQVVVLDVVFYRRIPGGLAVVGVVLSFVGAAFVMTEGDLRQLLRIELGIGEVLVFFSALSWAVYSVVGRDLLEEYSPLLVTTYAAAVGLVCLLPFLFVEPAATVAVYTDARAVALIFFLGFLGTAVGFLWYYQAVVALGAIATSVYINIIPVFGVLSAAVFLGEEASPALLGGGTLVLAGLLLVNRPSGAWREWLRPGGAGKVER